MKVYYLDSPVKSWNDMIYYMNHIERRNEDPVASYRVSKVKHPPPVRGGDRGECEKSVDQSPPPNLPPQGGGIYGDPAASCRELQVKIGINCKPTIEGRAVKV